MAGVDSVEHDEDLHELITGEAVALDLRSSSFVLRAAGTIIDYLVYFGGYILIIVILFSFGQQLGLDQALLTAISVAALVLCIVVIPTAVETLTQGKSLGKLAIGSRIVRDDGGSIGFRHAFIRSLTGVFEIFMTFGGLAAIIALLNGRAKRLGDLVAGTYSQNERVSKLVTPVYGVPLPLIEWSRTADVARLPDALARRVAAFLAQAAALTPTTRERLSRELADEVSVFVSPVPAANAELFLAAVVALRRDREFSALSLEQAGLERLAPVLGGMPRGFPDRG
ncbi:RDD family protein [Salinibacterium sp.]|uniref:RDD family protein n=1 Tax=Salinibacterium sp. TaxID=1915057 RepID=UPI00286CD9A5|nr:RDD family protein [Salinibacterium sp.]